MQQRVCLEREKSAPAPGLPHKAKPESAAEKKARRQELARRRDQVSDDFERDVTTAKQRARTNLPPRPRIAWLQGHWSENCAKGFAHGFNIANKKKIRLTESGGYLNVGMAELQPGVFEYAFRKDKEIFVNRLHKLSDRQYKAEVTHYSFKYGLTQKKLHAIL